ncbi:MAG: hypothetical protein WCO84_08645 [bacterium]
MKTDPWLLPATVGPFKISVDALISSLYDRMSELGLKEHRVAMGSSISRNTLEHLKTSARLLEEMITEYEETK